MDTSRIERHKTAIRRGDYSRPVKCLLRDNLLGAGVSFFDYGCGRGEDLEMLAANGIACTGWDPSYRPDAVKVEADVVNLGYVLNVIENMSERTETLRAAWGLCKKILAVSAQVQLVGRGKTAVEFGDGFLTCRNTFQKLYDQGELKAYLEAEIGVEAIPAGIGTFYLFNDELTQQSFLSNKYRRREIIPRRCIAELKTEELQLLLEPFMEVITGLGRLPDPDEFPGTSALVERFGSLKRAFATVQRLTGTDSWDNITQRRREDILVYLALSRFRKRPSISLLPRTLQRDMKAFFGSYSKACVEA